MKCSNDDTKPKGIAFCYDRICCLTEEDLNTTLEKLDLDYWNNWNKVSLHCEKYKVNCLKTTAKGAYYMHQKRPIYILINNEIMKSQRNAAI